MKKNQLIYFLAIIILIFLSGCDSKSRRNGKVVLIDSTLNEVTQTSIRPKVNIYIENSGSMDGYVNGETEFKDAISSLLVKLPYHYQANDIKIYFINSRIDSISTSSMVANIDDFTTEFEICWSRAKQIRSNSTNLNNIFKDILSQTDSNSISILISDCIYSIGDGSVKGLLSSQKNLTMSAFLQKDKNDKVPLATTIIKMSSKFDGNYPPYTGDKYKFPYTGIRPYYMCVISNQKILNDFNKKIKLKSGEIPGFENKFVLSSEDATSIYYTVLQSTYNRGRFRPIREESSKDYIHGIEDIDLQTNGGGCSRGKEVPLSFGVAVDFSKIHAEDDYLKDIANYRVTTNNFSIDSIISVDKSKIKPTDWNKIALPNPTHVIILSAKSKAVSDVSFVLTKQMPQWISQSTSEDDTDRSKLEGGKTFGLFYWLSGISNAYETIYPENRNFFECTISINQ